MKSHIRCDEENSQRLAELQQKLGTEIARPSIYHLGNSAIKLGIPALAKKFGVKLTPTKPKK